MAAMLLFTLSCFGILLFLWLAFGGALPLKPNSYRFTVSVPEATTLAQEADVRLAGVNVGKVKSKELDRGGNRTSIEVELQNRYAPIPKDTRAILRQKTLLGETYLELSPGHRSAGMLPDGARLPNSHVEPTTQLDEIFSAFDSRTRAAFRRWVHELATAIGHGRSQDLNDALGNLSGFSVDGAKLFKVLDEQDIAVRHLVRNTGRVFGAINERRGALRELTVNASNTFAATASRDKALAATFAIFPTFLDESKATLARLQRFAGHTKPLIDELRRPADDLGPTVRDLGHLAPNLVRLFHNLPPLITASRRGFPALEQTLRGAEPLLEALHPFFRELNPILSYLNYQQATVAGFLTNAGFNLAAKPGGKRVQEQILAVGPDSFQKFTTRPPYERGNAYLAPNALLRAYSLGTIESFDCNPAGGELKQPIDSGPQKQAPCFVQPPSLYSGKQFDKLQSGVAPNRPAPQGLAGNAPASPNR
jgi:phospholipid/cholesterol/gamma-HCH transport system substrate-binding protein